MKIVFFPGSCLPFHAKTLEERPLGGMETAIIRLAEAMAKLGHRVYVVSGLENPPLSNPLYLPLRAVEDIGACDILLAVREWRPLMVQLEAKLRFMWTGDSYDQPQNIGIGDARVANKIDCLLAVSNWHKARLCEESGFPMEKSAVLRNGIYAPFFEGEELRHPKRLIYSSTPYRGLNLLPQIYSEIKLRHPEAELHVFSGYQVYSAANGEYDQRALRDYQDLAQTLSNMPGCTVHDNVSQRQLAREFMKSALLAYPNTFEETSCITAMEAQAAGCPIVSSTYGALPETVGDSGLLMENKPGSAEYVEEFIEAVDLLLSDYSLWQALSASGKSRARSMSWRQVALDFCDMCAKQFGVS